MSDTSNFRILVLGLGSEALTDDGVPVKIIEDLKIILDSRYFDLQTNITGGLDLVDILKDHHKAVIIDTTKTPGRIPGDVTISKYPDLKESFHLTNTHGVSIQQVMEMGIKLGFMMPLEVLVITIEISDNLQISNEFSPEISSSYCKTVIQIKEKIESFLNS